MPMTRKKRVVIISSAVVLLVAIVLVSMKLNSKEGQPVQTSRVERRARLESKVTASGEIRPVKFYDLTAEVPGRVEQIFVNEGDSVKKGQPLVRVDPTQISTQVQGSEAAVRSTQADATNQQVAISQAENNVNQTKSNLIAAEADLVRVKADLNYAKAEYDRNLQLVESGTISKSVFDSAKSRYEQAVATVNAQEARIAQYKQQLHDAELNVQRARSQFNSAQARVKQTQASLNAQVDQLNKTTKFSPIDGVVSSLPVKVGQYALANFSTTPLLTVADMSQINAEIKVDETDIANVTLGQKAKVKVDALGETEIEGEVIEKGASAITRSGQTISQTTGSQEAKDFLVKIKLNPTPEVRDKLRPGMSTTAVITTATVDNVLTAPLQSIVPREVPNGDSKDEQPAAASGVAKKKEVEGIFVMRNDGKAHFVPVQTGIKGDQDIEIKSGVNQDEEIIIGPYKTLRALKDNDSVTKEKAPEAGNKNAGADEKK